MVELIQFKFIDGRLQTRHAQVVADHNGHLLVVQDDNGRVLYGDWKAAPTA
jgi:hypothetical protein